MAWYQKRTGKPRAFGRWSDNMFLQRAVIALTLGPLALLLVYLGGWFYFLPLALILLLATAEYVSITRRLGWHTSAALLLPAVLLQFVVAQWFAASWTGPAIVVALLAVLAYSLWLYEQRRSESVPIDWMGMSFGLLLLGWFGSHFFRLRGLEVMAWQWTTLILVSNWVADSAAYVVGKFLAGRILGKHPLSPRLSPNKTVEGYVGGIVLGTAGTAVAASLLQLPLLLSLLIALLISMVSPLGDLAISLLKREAGVKDSGTIFRGHGGALDRVDSLMWSVAMSYYVILLLS